MAERTFDIGGSFHRAKTGGDLIVNMAFASETPYERWWGIEVLQMNGVRLGRLNEGDGGPLLFNHDWNDLRGRHLPGSVKVEDKVLRGQVAIPQATQATRDAAALVEAKTLTKASVGYQIHQVIEKTTSKNGKQVARSFDGKTFERLLKEHSHVRDGRSVGGDLVAFRRALDERNPYPAERGSTDEPPVYLVTDWEPLENSLVTIPADNSVGVGRSAEVTQPAAPAASERKATMAESQAAAGAIAEVQTRSDIVVTDNATLGRTPAQLESDRRKAISYYCKANRLDGRHERSWIERGTSLEDMAKEMMELMAEREKDLPTRLDMERKDVQRYSVMRGLRASMNNDWRNAGLELEANKAISDKLKRLPRSERSFFVPLDIMMRERAVPQFGQRDWTVAGVNGSNYLVGTENRPGSFIELLRNTSVSLRAGVTRMSGLVGNVTIPKMTAGMTAYWLTDEATQVTESNPTLGQVSLSPKNVAALIELSHQLIQQSTPDAEQLVMDSIARDIALAVDVGVIRGAGSGGEPHGIVGTANLGSVSGTSLAAAGIIEFQTDCAGANALGIGMGNAYVTTPAVAGLLMARPELPTSGTTRMWTGNILEGAMLGFPAFSSAQMASATMLFGAWSTVVLGEWGVLELMTNPFSDFTRGLTGVRGWYTCDTAMRYPTAFSYASSIT